MKNKSTITLFCTAFLAIASALHAQDKTVTLSSLEWQPYVDPAAPSKSVITAVAEAAFKKSGYTVKFDFSPWERAVKQATEGVTDGLFPEYPDASRDTDFVASESLPCGSLALAKLKTKSVSFAKMEDLKSYTIGVVRGYVNTKDFDAASYLKKEEEADDVSNMRKLVRERLDLVVVDALVGDYLMANDADLKASKDKVDYVQPVLEEKVLVVYFSKKAKDYQAKLQAFNDGLKAIKADGTMDKIIEASGLKGKLK